MAAERTMFEASSDHKAACAEPYTAVGQHQQRAVNAESTFAWRMSPLFDCFVDQFLALVEPIGSFKAVIDKFGSVKVSFTYSYYQFVTFAINIEMAFIFEDTLEQDEDTGLS